MTDIEYSTFILGQGVKKLLVIKRANRLSCYWAGKNNFTHIAYLFLSIKLLVTMDKSQGKANYY